MLAITWQEGFWPKGNESKGFYGCLRWRGRSEVYRESVSDVGSLNLASRLCLMWRWQWSGAEGDVCIVALKVHLSAQ